MTFNLGTIIETKPARNGGEIVLFKRDPAPLHDAPFATIWRDTKTSHCYHGHYDLTLVEAIQNFKGRV